VATVDQIPAPAGDAVTFLLSPPRVFRTVALITAAACLLIRSAAMVAAMALSVSVDAADVVVAVEVTALSALAAGGGAALGAKRNPGWVRASAAGLEFAAPGCVPAFLPWLAVRSAGLRLAGPLTELVVTPTRPGAVAVAPMPGRVPRLRRRSGAQAFAVGVGMMTPGPAVLLAEVRRRLGPGAEGRPASPVAQAEPTGVVPNSSTRRLTS
jgi:hypothetical protein